jgi:Suppressor of fused protein (SUFU)
LPYLDGPRLEWLNIPGRPIRFLWLIPVTAAEVEFTKRHGIEAFESALESASFNYLDPSRKSIV